jgi:protein gp37
MNKTLIEWVKNPDGSQGYTLNSKTGCKNHTPEGLCLGGLFPCYAYKSAHGWLKEMYLANTNLIPDAKGGVVKLSISGQTAVEREGDYADPFYPRFWKERLEQPRKMLQDKGIFLDDMSDWMLDCWPREWTEAELQMMRDNSQHRFYTLTKQPQNLIKFSPFPENCWVGVTATNEQKFLEARISFAISGRPRSLSP